jgi:hypothetical protein
MSRQHFSQRHSFFVCDGTLFPSPAGKIQEENMRFPFRVTLAPILLLELASFSSTHSMGCKNRFSKRTSFFAGIELLSHDGCHILSENRERETGLVLSPRSRVGIFLLRIRGGFDVWADTPDGDETQLQSSRSAKAVRKAARQCPTALLFYFYDL